MLFYNHIISRLGQSADDAEWYVRAMCDSLNEYMADIEKAMMEAEKQARLDKKNTKEDRDNGTDN